MRYIGYSRGPGFHILVVFFYFGGFFPICFKFRSVVYIWTFDFNRGKSFLEINQVFFYPRAIFIKEISVEELGQISAPDYI